MSRRQLFWAGAFGSLLLSLSLNLSVGAGAIGPGTVFDAIFRFDPETYEHFVVLYQRVPRALIALQGPQAEALELRRRLAGREIKDRVFVGFSAHRRNLYID